MEVAKIRVSSTSITVLERNTIPAGLIGGTITIDYADSSWSDLKKTVVFKGAVTKDVVTDDISVRIPGEVLAESGKKLYVGIYGTDLVNNKAIPTLYADLGVIKAAADPYDDNTADPALPMWFTLSNKVDGFEKEIGEFEEKISGFEEDISQFEETLTSLTDIAASAADSAQKAADNAENAAEESKNAAEAAKNALSGVENATNNANAAAQNANNSAANANNAVQNAENAAQQANTAAASAIQIANTAAVNATKTASDAAESAKTIANNAAANANAAAAATNEAMESLVGTANTAIEEIRSAASTGIDGTAIVQAVRGEVITADDSADRLLRGLKVFGRTEQVTTTGKNLCNPNAFSNTGYYTVDEDGYINYRNDGANDYYPILGIQVAKGSYAVALDIASATGNATVYVSKTANDYTKQYKSSTVVTFADAELVWFCIAGKNGATMKVRITVNAGTTALPYEPYTGGNPSPNPEYPQELESVGDVTVTVAGKNLFDSSVVVNRTHNGITTSVGADGSVYISGTATGYRYIKADDNVFLVLPAGTYTLAPAYVNLHTVENNKLSGTFELEQETPIANAAFAFVSGEFHNEVVYIQLETGSTATAYEPYKEIQTLPISTLNGLSGIPVESGGNYTDSNGKHWICDEVDFEKGMYVQRVKLVTYDGSEDWSFGSAGESSERAIVATDAKRSTIPLSNMLPGVHTSSDLAWTGTESVVTIDSSGMLRVYRISVSVPEITGLDQWKAWLKAKNDAGMPFSVLYILAEENHIPLSAEQLAAFASLHSNYPNTTVFNDKDAGMEVKYVADTKLYIDQKFNELAAALVSNV